MQIIAQAFTLIFVFILILILIRLKVDLGISLLVSSFVLAIIYTFNPVETILIFIRGATNVETLRILEIVVSAIALSGFMERNGYLSKMTDSSMMVLSDPRLVFLVVPALIGLLPMPAGALVSAIMINDFANRVNLNREVRTFVNYWFRHIWEYSWPLYQGIILESVILGATVQGIVYSQVHLTFIAIILGFIFGFKRINLQISVELKRDIRKGLLGILNGLWPILLVIVFSLGTGVDISLTLPISLLLTLIVSRLKFRDIKTAFKNAFSPSLLLSIIGVMIFKEVLEDTGAVQTFYKVSLTYNLPPITLVILIPFITGLVTGVTVAFVGISYPVLLPFLKASEIGVFGLSSLAYASGMAGIMLSPLHLCLVFSSKYFEADLSKVYKFLYKPSTLIFTAQLITYHLPFLWSVIHV